MEAKWAQPDPPLGECTGYVPFCCCGACILVCTCVRGCVRESQVWVSGAGARGGVCTLMSPLPAGVPALALGYSHQFVPPPPRRVSHNTRPQALGPISLHKPQLPLASLVSCPPTVTYLVQQQVGGSLNPPSPLGCSWKGASSLSPCHLPQRLDSHQSPSVSPPKQGMPP